MVQHGDIHHIQACKHTMGLKLSGTSFNGQKQQRIDLNADALYNEKQENLRVWLLKLLISKKPASILNVQKMFIRADQRLGLHGNDVFHISQASSSSNDSAHNRSELGNSRPQKMNRPSSKLVPKVLFL
ncbi:hypothetical protein Tco_0362696 [Tanacetum coccineum]